MRLLVLTYRLPLHTCTADRYAVFHFVKHFSRRHRITLVAFAESGREARQAARLERYCERVIPVVLPRWRAWVQAARGLVSGDPLSVWFYRSVAMRSVVRRIVAEGGVDLAYVYHLRMAQYLAGLPDVPKCVALQPVQVLNLRRFESNTKHPLWKAAYALEHRRMARYELDIARRFDRCLVISEKDRRALDPKGELRNVFLNPHGLDPEYFRPDASAVKEASTIIFHGSMRYQANADAIVYFTRHVYPAIRRQVPEAKLLVVGYEPPRAVRALARDTSVVVTGAVEDVRPYLHRAQVAIDPLRIGAGLQNKVLESMAVGLPVVATALANEGIGAKPGEELIIGEQPRDFAQSVVTLFRDEGLRRRIGAAARRFIERRWSWEAHYAPLERVFEELASAHGRPGAAS